MFKCSTKYLQCIKVHIFIWPLISMNMSLVSTQPTIKTMSQFKNINKTRLQDKNIYLNTNITIMQA